MLHQKFLLVSICVVDHVMAFPAYGHEVLNVIAAAMRTVNDMMNVHRSLAANFTRDKTLFSITEVIKVSFNVPLHN